MPSRRPDADYEDDDDSDAPLLSDMDDNAGSLYADTVPCPYCGRRIHELAEQCHVCRRFISREDSRERKPAWIFVTAVLLLAMILFVWLR